MGFLCRPIDSENSSQPPVQYCRYYQSQAKMSLKRKCDDAVEENNKHSKKMHWSLGLKTSMEDPNLKVEEDDKVVIIKDKYPKAKYHFLILPKENIPKLTSLTKSHVELLVHMQKKGEKLMKKYDSKLSFKLGYHAVPSMSQLHLHVISCDFDSVCLKTKRHWNSFTTDYFVPSNDVIEKLKNDGKVTSTDHELSKKFLNTVLKCHGCKEEQKTMPKLKEHLKKCPDVKLMLKLS